MGKYRRILFTTMIVIISCLTIMQGAANAVDPNQEGTQKSQFSTDLRFIFTQIAKATIPAVVHIEVT